MYYQFFFYTIIEKLCTLSGYLQFKFAKFIMLHIVLQQLLRLTTKMVELALDGNLLDQVGYEAARIVVTNEFPSARGTNDMSCIFF